MSIAQAYDKWSEQYDSNTNKTRDLEAIALREMLHDFEPCNILEIGCGTGKNSAWLLNKANILLAVDFSEQMLLKAKQKINDPRVNFIQADINQPWLFTDGRFDLITFSLVLEHIQNLDFIFEQARQKLHSGGLIYIGELHPFKQYSGSRARFDTNEGINILECYTHN